MKYRILLMGNTVEMAGCDMHINCELNLGSEVGRPINDVRCFIMSHSYKLSHMSRWTTQYLDSSLVQFSDESSFCVVRCLV